MISPPTQRRPDWQVLLNDCITRHLGLPFVWGSQDCCLFAADCVIAMTDQDPAADLRGTYRSRLTAHAVLKAHGGLHAIAAARLGPPVPVASAWAGDVGLTTGGKCGDLLLCVFTGQHWLAPAAGGLAVVPVEPLNAWSVAHG